MLEPGQTAPLFELPNQDGELVSLADFDSTVVVYFYPRADTPGCTTEACGFRDSWDDFEARDVPVLGISDDPVAEESATLLLRLDEADMETTTARVEDLGGEVDAELEFETLRVVLPEPAVTDLCELDGLESIETDATIQMGGGDAGEDVELNDS
jgi:alkyl hydroperoxide reductase subunit AhpC